MNLIGDPWIPVVFQDGTQRDVGLQEAYKRGKDIRDLVATPPQRVALMRLFLCITHAALDGPKDENDWKRCKKKIAGESLKYLKRHEKKFELYGSTPFLQIPELKPTHNATIDKLDLSLAAGNNLTLFDQEAGPEGRESDPARIALNLLTFQCYSPGGKIGPTSWAGKKTKRESEHAPCIEASLLATLIRGADLVESIWLNLITKALIRGIVWGRPAWDARTSKGSDDLEKQIAKTFLGRMVPIPRAILLEEDTLSLTLANGISYPKFPDARDTMATVILRRDGNQAYLSTNLQKHPWRELGGILCVQHAGMQGSAYALSHLTRSGCRTVDVWVGGLVADKGKLIDSAEWTFSVPVKMLQQGFLDVYSIWVDLANKGEQSLREATKTYRDSLNSGSGRFSRDAITCYWGMLDVSREELIDLVNKGGDERLWRRRIWRCMQSAYAFACPRETPRQIMAYAVGLKRLVISDRKEKDQFQRRSKKGVTHEQE